MLPPLHQLAIDAVEKRKRGEDPDDRGGVRRAEAIPDTNVVKGSSVVSEYDTVLWTEEFNIDSLQLAYDVLYEDEVDEKGFERAEKLPMEREAVQLFAARKETRMIQPAQNSLRQQYVQNMRSVRPFAMDPKEFLLLVNEVKDMSGGLYYMWSLPIEPVQMQYARVRLHQACGIVLWPAKSLTFDDVDTQSSFPRAFRLFKEGFLVVSADRTYKASEAVANLSTESVEAGGLNSGRPVSDADMYALKDAGLFELCNAVFENDQDGDTVFDTMVQKTGLWYRTNLESQQGVDIMGRNHLELYLSLWSALVGTSLPIYWITCGLGDVRRSISERALGDLELFPAMLPGKKLSQGAQRAYSKMIGRRFSSCMLRLAELGFLLLDNKPKNMLLQRSYFDLQQIYFSQRLSATDWYVADVVVTDLDPLTSLFVNSLPANATLSQGQYLRDYNVEAECIRFANSAVFAMAAGCFGLGSALPVMNAVVTPLKRYAGLKPDEWEGAFFCKHFFDPLFMKDYNIHGERWINPSDNGKVMKLLDDMKDIFKEAGDRGIVYEYMTPQLWKKFWSAAASNLVYQVFKYGMRTASGAYNIICYDVIQKLSEIAPDIKLSELGALEKDENFPTFGVIVALIANWALLDLAKDS